MYVSIVKKLIWFVNPMTNVIITIVKMLNWKNKSKKNNNWIKIEQTKVKNKLYFSLIILCKNEETITPSAKKDKEEAIQVRERIFSGRDAVL